MTDNFISRRAASGLIHSLAYSLSEKIRDLSRYNDTPVWEAESSAMNTPFSLLLSVAKTRREVLRTAGVLDFVADFYVLAFLISRLDISASLRSLCSQAKEIWSLTREEVGGEGTLIENPIKRTLRDFIADVDCRVPLVESFAFTGKIAHKT